jgi:hypothetical protein
MSPWLASARPYSASRSPSALIGVPASAVALRPSRSTSARPRSFSSESMVWSVGTSGENEWPLPTTRSLAPRAAVSRTAAISASMLSGLTTRSGVALTLPDQLVHFGLRPNTRRR